MSPHSQAFITYLQGLQERNRGAIATLRHSLSLPPGTDRKAFAIVERFAGTDCRADDAHRLALYFVAGLFAGHPKQGHATFAQAFGALYRERESGSIQQRFISLLEADPGRVLFCLRQAISLLAADEQSLDYGQLIDDLSVRLDPLRDDDRWQALRQRWGRDFFKAALADEPDRIEPEAFTTHLVALASPKHAKHSPAALATLRRSLTFAPGDDPRAMPWVEPFVGRGWHPSDTRRRARYVVAGLFALNPERDPSRRFASALKVLAQHYGQDSDTVERRFIVLLGARGDNVLVHLRQFARRLAAERIGYDPTRLLKDLRIWMRREPDTWQLDQLRKHWARDFYRTQGSHSDSTPASEKPRGYSNASIHRISHYSEFCAVQSQPRRYRRAQGRDLRRASPRAGEQPMFQASHAYGGRRT